MNNKWVDILSTVLAAQRPLSFFTWLTFPDVCCQVFLEPPLKLSLVTAAAVFSLLPCCDLHLDFSRRRTPGPGYSVFPLDNKASGSADTSSFLICFLMVISVVPWKAEAPAHFTVEEIEAPGVTRLVLNHVLWTSERWIWELYLVPQPLSLI